MKPKKKIIIPFIILAVLFVLSYLPVLYVKVVREFPFDKSRLAMLNILAYRDTPAWTLAKAVFDEDTVEIRRQVIEKHVPVDIREPLYSFNLLMIASAQNKPRSVRTLLCLGADPNARDTIFNATPLILATGYHKNSELVKTLLDYGADPNVNTHLTVDYRVLKDGINQGTPLINAIEEKSLAIVKLLVEAGADVNAYPAEEFFGSYVNESLVHRSPDIALYLISQGADYRVKFIYADGSEGNILTLLRYNIFDIGSEKYKQKMELVSWLKTQGLDYDKIPIEDYVLKDIQREHPDDWEEYIKKY